MASFFQRFGWLGSSFGLYSIVWAMCVIMDGPGWLVGGLVAFWDEVPADLSSSSSQVLGAIRGHFLRHF